MVVRSTSIARRAFTADEFAAMQAAGVAIDATWHDGDVCRADGAAYCFSVAEYHRLIDIGLLGEDERVELIHGEVIETLGIGDRHAACVDLLSYLLNLRMAGRAVIRVQNPVVLSDSEPEPDLSIVPYAPGVFSRGKPTASDVMLVIEVADTSLAGDLGDRAELYAENGIPEYWVVDLVGHVVHVHTSPRADGSWGTVTTLARGESIAAPLGVTVNVDEMLP
jgi:Uma2 family endonuclease